jgi:sodium-dependent dicarboxylate transporter 2/3/5
MGVATPTAIVIIIAMYIFFAFFYLRNLHLPDDMDESTFRENYERLGPMSPAEIIVGIDFILLAVMWLFRGDLGSLVGWSNQLHNKGSSIIQDGTVAMALGIILFIIHVPHPTEREERMYAAAEVDLELRKRNNHNIRRFHSPLELPSDDGDDEEETIEEQQADDDDTETKWVPIIDWEYAQSKIPWTILFLFAGGFALNQGFTDSTLSKWIGSKLVSLTNLPLFVLLLCICLITSILSNIASNTACANILLPIVASIARTSQKHHPWVLMIPTAFATSVCFIMPVATPPNLICFGSGRLDTMDFMTAGTFINIISLFIVIVMCMFLVPNVLDANSFPDWALPSE